MSEKITINLIHPTKSDEVLTAAVSANATPAFLVGQMVQAGFLPAAGTAGQYKLRDTKSGRQLLDNVTLADAGLPDGVTLMVDHATTGARPETRR
jgi:hypothetical protein